MSLRFNPRWLVWFILVLCIVAIPVALIGRKSYDDLSNDNDLDSTDLAVRFTDRIQVIRLSGMIMDKQDSSLFGAGEGASSSALKFLRKAAADGHVKAVLLRVNSPGGTVSASQELTDEVMALRSKNKPVVVSMADIAASGGYYIATAGDKIVAEPGTITGSIGVIFNAMNLKALGDKIGVQSEVVKSGQFKDIGSPFRPFTAEDRAILQGLITDSYDQFVQAVAKGRNMPVEAVKKLADGRIYSGRQALKLGLIDQLGGYDTALDVLQAMCQERYKMKTKLPVEEVSGGGILAGLSALRKTFKFSVNSFDETGAADKLIPPFLNEQFYHMPLWIMQ
jgi:protease-4